MGELLQLERLRRIKWSNGHRFNRVKMCNNLVESASRLTRQEYQMLIYALSYLKKSDKELQILEFKTSDVVNDLRLGKGNYKKVYSITKSLCSKMVELKGNENEAGVPWGLWVGRNEKRGYVNFVFNPILSPYLLNLEERYTETSRFYILKFKNVYTVKLYLYLMKWRNYYREKNIKKHPMNIFDFRKIFALSDFLDEKDIYTRHESLKRKVLDPAIKEINEVSDYYALYKDFKGVDGREKGKLEFYYQLKKPSKESDLIRFNDIEDFKTYAETLWKGRL